MKKTHLPIMRNIQMLICSILLIQTISATSNYDFANTSKAVLTCNLDVTTDDGSITIDGINASHVIIKLFNPDWSINYECTDNCNNIISNLTDGTYYLSVKLFNSSWQSICQETQYVTVTNDGGGGGGGSGPCDVSWTTTSSSITIDGLNDAGHTIFKLFSPSWQTVYNCFDDCPEPVTVNGLTNGATYHLSYQLYDNNWQQTCNETVDVVISGGGGDPKADLRLADLTSPSDARLGEVVYYTVDLINSGDVFASGNHTTGFYLSNNSSYSSDDVLVGQFITANTPVGTTNDVVSAITVPANFATGNYYLIGRADINNSIDEGNENNNTVSKAISINNPGGGGDDCGFMKTINDNIVNTFSASRSTVTESSDQYAFKSSQISGGIITESFLRIDKSGNYINTTSSTSGISNNTLSVSEEGDDILNYSKTTALGILIWDRSVTVNPPAGDMLGFFDSAIIRFNDGYLLTGEAVTSVNGTTTFFWFNIVTNNDGIIQHTVYEEVPDTWRTNGSYKIPGEDSYILRIYTGGEERLFKISAVGEILWNVPLYGDFPSTDLYSVKFGPNGQYIFFAIEDNWRARVRKINLSNGNLDGNYILADILAPSQSTYFELIREVLPTSDGGFIVAYPYQKPGDQLYGFQYGKVDANGNPVWSGILYESSVEEENYELTPVHETNEGGTLFIGKNENGEPMVMKLTSEGLLSPSCGGGGDGTPIACDIKYTFSGGTLTLTGSGLDAGHVILKVFSPSWQTEYSCFDNCGSSITLDNLSNGTYHISINTYNSNWSPICDELVDINLNSGNPLENEEANEILFFNAMKNGRNASLNWVVNNSYKTEYFTIERSVDGDSFEFLSDMNTLGESDQELVYQTTDNDPISGFNYYRVKQIFTDGSIRYSQMKQVVFDLDLSTVAVYPNPATDEIFIHLHEFEGESASIIIYDQLGQGLISTQVDELTTEALQVQTQNLQSGIYHVAIKVGEHKMISKKLVISKL